MVDVLVTSKQGGGRLPGRCSTVRGSPQQFVLFVFFWSLLICVSYTAYKHSFANVMLGATSDPNKKAQCFVTFIKTKSHCCVVVRGLRPSVFGLPVFDRIFKLILTEGRDT